MRTILRGLVDIITSNAYSRGVAVGYEQGILAGKVEAMRETIAKLDNVGRAPHL